MNPNNTACTSFSSGTLVGAPVDTLCVIRSVNAPASNPELKAQLEDIGFIVGETVQVTVRGFPGNEPIAVRVGASTFALRRIEASCIHVEAVPR